MFFKSRRATGFLILNQGLPWNRSFFLWRSACGLAKQIGMMRSWADIGVLVPDIIGKTVHSQEDRIFPAPGIKAIPDYNYWHIPYIRAVIVYLAFS